MNKKTLYFVQILLIIMFVGSVNAQQSAKKIEMMAINGKLGIIGSEKGKEFLLALNAKNENCKKKQLKTC